MNFEALSQISPGAVVANYREESLAQFKGNKLIEALPPSPSDEQLAESLLLSPNFDSSQRELPTHQRLHLVKSLQNFMVPLDRHMTLARTIDSMLRSGYVGRAPITADSTKIAQRLYELQMSGGTFRQSADTRPAQLSTSLIGLSGMGKTSTVNRCLASLPKVIYHPELNVYQIPYLHVEMPSDGSSIKGLAYGILQQVDQLVPGAKYFSQYMTKSGRYGADSLMRGVAQVMHQHYVGLLVADEVQNLANSTKGGQTVMTELVSACNELKVPILFIGTNKANKVLTTDFRQARRSSGHGLSNWTNLQEDSEDWEDFCSVLWSFQWVRNPVRLDFLLTSQMYRLSQGVIDVAIKLFASAQARAMADGTETLTVELLESVYQTEFSALHRMLDALRRNDHAELCKYDDIAPFDFNATIESLEQRSRRASSQRFKKLPGTDDYKVSAAASLMAMGVDEDEALRIADTGATKGLGVAEFLNEASKQLAPVKPTKSAPKGKDSSAADQEPSYMQHEDDLRKAIYLAGRNNTTPGQELRKLGLLLPLTELLDFET